MKKIEDGIMCPWCQGVSALDVARYYTYADGCYQVKCPHCGEVYFLETTAEGLYNTEHHTPEWIMRWERLANLIINAPAYGAAFAEKYLATMKEGGMLNGI